MKKLSESVWADMRKKSLGREDRIENIRPQEYEYWWENIPLDKAPKYKKEELALWDFLYVFVIWKVEKAMNIKKPKTIRIYFKHEDGWYISIFHNTAHGSDNYTLEGNGTKKYSPSKWSEMSLKEKRSIRYRLETKKFYIYKEGDGQWAEYILTEEPEMNGKKGVPML